MHKIIVSLVVFYALLFPTPALARSVAGGSVNMSSHGLGDTITITGTVKGEQCKGRPVMEAIMLETRGGSPNGTPNLDLSQAKISAWRNNVSISGTTRYYSPIPAVNAVVLDFATKGEPLVTDTFRIVVTNAKAKSIGKIALSVIVTTHGLTSVECGWDSSEYKLDYQITSATPKPTIVPSPEASSQTEPILLEASSAPSISPTLAPQSQSPTTTTQIISWFQNLWARYRALFHPSN